MRKLAGLAVVAGALSGAGALRYLKRRTPAGQLAAAAKQVEVGRRLAIYERDTGLLAHWYLELRCDEECYRAERYSRPFSFLVVEPRPGSQEWTISEELREWLAANARKSDIVGYLGNGRYVLLLPEADGERAKELAARIQDAVPSAEVGIACLPQDGRSFAHLLAAAERRLGQPEESAA